MVQIAARSELPSLKLDRAFIFGGAYGNLQATEAILSEAKRRGFSSDEIIFTGDCVAYCGQPQETADLIRLSGVNTIMGNCEEALANDFDTCGCGFEEGTVCNLLSDQWFRFCRETVNQETKSWMGTLPKQLELEIGAMHFLVCHATPGSINRFIFPSTFDQNHFDVSQNGPFDGYIVGHSGIPFVREQADRLWVNSGAAGMPANDGTPRVWFATLQTFNGALSVTTEPLTYDHNIAMDVMESKGLVNGYQDCLETGIWPSHDVLPEIETAATGNALQPLSFDWLHRTAA